MVSVVIPTYNRARDLERALKSVLAQTYPHWEVLVVDNHSTDDTEDVVTRCKDPRMKVFKTHNQGVIAASRNLGIRQACGEYVAFLDSDDSWSPRKLEESVTYLSRGADVVYHDLFLMTKPGQRFFWRRARSSDVKPPVFQDLIANGNALTNSSVVVRRTLLQAIDGLSEDPDLVAVEDYDAWLRIASLSDRFQRIPRVLGYYWAGGGTMSHPDRMIRSLGVLEGRYARVLGESGGGGSPVWLRYAKGQAHYWLGSYEEARRLLDPIRWRHIRFRAWLNCRWMRLVCVSHQWRRQR